MNAPPPIEKRPTLASIAVLARWFLGGIFVYMGLSKALHPDEFVGLVRQYDVISSPLLLNAIAALLPWFEVFCGLMLLAGVAVRGSALVLIALLVPFTLVMLRRTLAAAAAQHVSFCAVKFNCGCSDGDAFFCNKLVENIGLFLIACWLLASRSRRFCLRFNLN
jgi:uncharacterized membrane protein YphA (DoxX/SURF4 family)